MVARKLMFYWFLRRTLCGGKKPNLFESSVVFFFIINVLASIRLKGEHKKVRLLFLDIGFAYFLGHSTASNLLQSVSKKCPILVARL